METVIEIGKTKKFLQVKLTEAERKAKAHEAAARARDARVLDEESESTKKRARNLAEQAEAARLHAGELLATFDTGIETRETEVRYEFNPKAVKAEQVREIRCDTDELILTRAATGPELEVVRDKTQVSIEEVTEGGKGGRKEKRA